MKKITNNLVVKFRNFLIDDEKSAVTVEKYIRDISSFALWVKGNEITKATVLAYKQMLMEKYAPTSVNSMLSSLNSFFAYNEWYDCRVKTLKIQRQIFRGKEKELTKAEYERLLRAAKQKNNLRLYYVMQTICSTGIRISELKYVSCDAVKRGRADINCKGKIRVVMFPKELCRMLTVYMKENHIKSGSVFVSRSGKPLDRSNIWSDMKKLCDSAGISKEKVFPHNLRHLFAFTYYSVQKDIIRLADILGHSNVNTTRIYTMESGETHRRQIQKLGLLLC